MTTYAMNRVVETAMTLDEKTRSDLTFEDMTLVAAGVHSGTGEADLRQRLRAMALSNRMTRMELTCRMKDNARAWYQEVLELRAENERLRGLIKTYRHMLRYDWIAQQDRTIKELNAEIDALRGEGE